MEATHNAFADVPHTPRGHLGLLFYESVYLLTRHLFDRAFAAGKSADTVFASFPFLSPYWEELKARLPRVDEPAQFAAACESWEAASPHWLPLAALRKQAGVRRELLTSLVMAGLAEEDAHFGELFAALQMPLGRRRPTLGLLQLLMASHGSAFDASDGCRTLFEMGLLAPPDRDAPRAEWELRIPLPLWNALRGEHSREPLPGAQYHSSGGFTPVATLALAPAQCTRLTELVTLLATDPARSLIVRGMGGNPRLQIVGSVAHDLGYGLLEIDPGAAADETRRRLLGPLCALLRAVPVFSLELGPGERFNSPPLPGYLGPVAIIAGCEGGIGGALMERSVHLQLEPETLEQRGLHWRLALPGQPAADLDHLARCFTMGGAYISRAAPLALANAALDRRRHVTPSDVRVAARTIGHDRLDSLAARLEDGGTWQGLVVPAHTETQLRDLQERCRHREQLARMMAGGLPGGLNRGVRALFEGPSGTGKTLAARVLANELGLDLYRVDLAAIVNKYIGETEKNLSRVLSRAEDLDVILLLDEGDSLMTRRTDVKSAQDRYANLETNYLLQRLETYTGIVIVTTNAGSAIDSAFRRRIEVAVKFHLPDAEERLRLWELHLAPGHALAPDNLEQIALRYEITGGQIRNAAVHAAMIALSTSRETVSMDDVSRAIQAEYRKAGAAVTLMEHRQECGPGGRLAGFLSAIS